MGEARKLPENVVNAARRLLEHKTGVIRTSPYAMFDQNAWCFIDHARMASDFCLLANHILLGTDSEIVNDN